jgi:hypothetical protein
VQPPPAVNQHKTRAIKRCPRENQREIKQESKVLTGSEPFFEGARGQSSLILPPDVRKRFALSPIKTSRNTDFAASPAAFGNDLFFVQLLFLCPGDCRVPNAAASGCTPPRYELDQIKHRNVSNKGCAST